MNDTDGGDRTDGTEIQRGSYVHAPKISRENKLLQEDRTVSSVVESGVTAHGIKLATWADPNFTRDQSRELLESLGRTDFLVKYVGGF